MKIENQRQRDKFKKNLVYQTYASFSLNNKIPQAYLAAEQIHDSINIRVDVFK